MVLGRKIEEWLERDDVRQRELEEEERRRAEAAVDDWLATYGLPPLNELMSKGYTEDQAPAVLHVVDVARNKQCTDPNCPYRNDTVPDFIKK